MSLILVIDDDGIVRDALNAFLTRAGHRVITAADGGNGVLLFKNRLPDLVILDRDLPVMSGSKVFDKIRAVSKKAPIIVLSGYNEPAEVDAYLRFGAAAFLYKGDGLSPVLAAIDRLLGVRYGEGSSLQAFAPPDAAAARAGAAELVLIADDDQAFRTVLRRFLSSLSYEILEAETGDAAIELARARRPDIVLLDISMPGKDGVSVLKELAPEMPATGFMMISGGTDEEAARACLQYGAFDYISKPVNLEKLGLTIKTRLLLQRI